MVLAALLTSCGNPCGGKETVGEEEGASQAAPSVPTLSGEDFTRPGEGARPSQEGRDDPVIAWVGESGIVRSELEAQLSRRIEVFRSSGREDDAVWRNSQRRSIVRHLVEEEILRQTLDRENIVVSDDELQAALDAEISAVFTSDAHFARYLERRGLTEAEYGDRKRYDLRIERLIASRSTAAVTEGDVRAYYDQFRERWRSPERVECFTITVRLRQDPSDEEHREALERVTTLRHRIVEEGEDFGAVAEAHSESPERYRGGEMGWIYADDLNLESAIRDTLFEMEEGDVSEPVRTRLGYQIFLVSAHRDTGYRDFEEVEEVLWDLVGRRSEQITRGQIVNEMTQLFDVGYAEAYYGLEQEQSDEDGTTSPYGRARHSGDNPIGN